jgi:NAD(P)-dependent dehydrogenase (short-subunit alcohol dehydrogenase family)
MIETSMPEACSDGCVTCRTGASSGIGAACALHLDRLGYLLFAGVRKKEDGDALKRQASERLRIVFIDVVDATSIAAAAETVEAAVAGAGLSGLVNNAGIAVAGPLEFLPVDDLRKQFEVNVIGPIAVTQAFLPLLRRGHGRIVNMGSIGGRWATPFAGPYSASKFALEAFNDDSSATVHLILCYAVSSASAFSSQYVMPMSRYIVVAAVRYSCASWRLPVRRESRPSARWQCATSGRIS